MLCVVATRPLATTTIVYIFGEHQLEETCHPLYNASEAVDR